MGDIKTADRDLERFVERFPGLLLNFVLPPTRLIPSDSENYLRTVEAAEEIYNGLSNYEDMIRQSPDRWGALLDLHKDYGHKFKELIRKSAVGSVEFSTASDHVSPFKLDLPCDAVIIPHILNVIVQSMWESSLYIDDASSSSKSRRDRARELIEEYLSEADDLVVIINNGDMDPLIRSCCAMLYLLHPNDLAEHVQLCLDKIINYYQSAPSWYLAAAGASLVERIPSDERCLRAMGRLLDMARDDFSGRIALNRVIDVWRERSLAPVQSCGLAIFQ